jgi:hypothetical protein
MAQGQSIQMKDFDTKDFPKVIFRVADRNPVTWKEGEVKLEEEAIPVEAFTLTPLEAPKRTQKKVFILFENSHFPSFDPQRTALKAILKNALPYFSEKDQLFFAEFDWTLANGKVLQEEKIFEGNKSTLVQQVEAIQRPAANQKNHESTELNTALMEALEYLHQQPKDSTFDKAILLFSSEFSNIYNSIHTPESIILSSRQKNIPIYTVRYPRMGAKYSLQKITSETFGEHVAINPSQDWEDQAADLGKIIESMTSRAAGALYEITYNTKKGPGGSPVGLTLSKTADPIRYESFFTTPSYFAYVLMDGTRLGLASGLVVFLLMIGVLLVLRSRKKKSQEKEANERKIQGIQEESKRELEKQERFLEKLEKEQREQREQEIALQQAQEKQRALQASNARFEQLVRVPLLIGQDGSHYSLQQVNLLGRTQGPQTTLLIPDPTVSREHALILFERRGIDQLPEANQSFNLVDLGSSNGTFVNEKQIQAPTPLKNGDFIRLGKVTFTFRQ